MLAELVGARRWAAEVRATAARRAAEVGRLRSGVVDLDARAVMHAAQLELAALLECADGLCVALAGDLAELAAAIPDEPAGKRAAR